MSDLRAWVWANLKPTPHNFVAGWQSRLACRIPSQCVGDVDAGLLGSIYCAYCPEHNCQTVDTPERLEGFVTWCVQRAMQRQRHDAESSTIRELRTLEDAAGYGLRRVG